MRYSLLLALCSLVSFASLTAQRVGELRFAVPYHQLPAQELPADFTTYSTAISDPYRSVSRAGLTKLGLKNQLKLRNYRPLATGGHFLITYKVGYFNTNGLGIKSQTTETKSKDGKVTKTTTYWVDGTYTYPVTMEVVDTDGGIIFESVVGSEEKPIRYPSGTRTYSNRTALSKDWSAAYAKTLQEIRRSALNNNVTGLNSQLRNQIDIQEKKDYFYFEYPKGKKAENADLWLAHATEAKTVLDTIDSGTPLPKAYLTSALAPHVAFWKEQAAAYDPNDKKTQRYYHSAAFNLATLEVILENPGAAQDFSNILIENVKWNKDRSKNINSSAEKLAAELPSYPGLSRHFSLRDVAQAVGPSNPTYGRPEPIAPEFDTIAGYVTLQGARKAGNVIIQENVAVRLTGKPNFRFIDANEQEIEIAIDKVDGFGFGDYDYVVEKWADNGGLQGRPNFMRVLMDGPRMQYLEYVPSYSDAGGLEVEFLKQKSDNDLVSLSIANARWLNWKKAFAKVFTDCPGLAQKIEAGDYRRNVDDIAAAVLEYNEGNCELAAEAEGDDDDGN